MWNYFLAGPTEQCGLSAWLLDISVSCSLPFEIWTTCLRLTADGLFNSLLAFSVWQLLATRHVAESVAARICGLLLMFLFTFYSTDKDETEQPSENNNRNKNKIYAKHRKAKQKKRALHIDNQREQKKCLDSNCLGNFQVMSFLAASDKCSVYIYTMCECVCVC